MVYGLLLTGCLSRTLMIRTDPPGALVYVNDQFKGASPVSYDFLWYGWHRLMVRKEGFERLEDHKLLRAPSYLWIPFDLAAEIAPWTIRDDRTWSYTLTPEKDLPAPIPPPIQQSTQLMLPPGETTAAPQQMPASPPIEPTATEEASPGQGADGPSEGPPATTKEPVDEPR